MILLFTDFGLDGPYQGQMKMVLAARAPGIPVIDLMADAPVFRPQEAAYLLAALFPECPEGSVILAVVDHGVGGARPPLACKIAGRWLVGPGNGLLEILVRRYGVEDCREIVPEAGARLTASFHGRDLFAPAAARLALGDVPQAWPEREFPRHADWPDDWAAVIYVDGYGNLMTGLRAASLTADTRLKAGWQEVEKARTFSDLPKGQAFWYENSNGLAEIAVNQGSAAQMLGLKLGNPIVVIPS